MEQQQGDQKRNKKILRGRRGSEAGELPSIGLDGGDYQGHSWFT